MTQDDGYAGDVSAKQAWEMLERDEDAHLIDVRTRAEWMFVGVPDTGDLGKPPLFVEWQNAQGRNPDFVEEIRAKLAESDAAKDAPLLFLCRSGGRSRAAAMACTGAGLGACYNVAGGFEGDLDQSRHRNTVNGWRRDGLPWVQS